MKDKIIKIIDNKPSRLRESYFINNHGDIYDKIVEYTIDLELSFKERLWCFVNKKTSYVLCSSCINRVSFNKKWTEGYKTYCSTKCTQSSNKTKEKRKKTVLEKYGVDNIAKSQDIKKKQEQTNIERWGHKSSFQNEEVRERWKTTIEEKYGVDHYFKTDEFKEKTREFSLEKYGVDHPSKSKEVQNKISQTNIEKYGVDHISKTQDFWISYRNKSVERYGVAHPLKSIKIRDKIEDSNMEKYGVDNYFKTTEFKEKSKKHFLDKFGVDHYTKSDEYKTYLKSDRYKNVILKNRIKFYNDKGFTFISNSSREGFVLLSKNNSCGHQFEIHPTTLQRRIDASIETCTVCNPINSGESSQESNILDFLKELDQNVIHSDRTLISPYEINFLIKEKKIAIEYNGLYWHSELNKDKYYHYEKMNRCLSNNYDLINIWEDDWLYKNDIIKSVVKNRLGLITDKVFARKCDMLIISDKKLVNNFLDNNHLQGKTNWSTAIGLFYDNELVSVIAFHNNKKRIELVRFCNKINLVVVGSASKLFKKYIKTYDVDEIYSFSESSVFNGGLYTSLNFELNGETPINYWWNVGGIRRHRFSFNKKKLIKMGGDSNKTEVSIMHDMGNYRVWGCCLKRWVWKRS